MSKTSRRPRLPDSLQATLTARLDRLPTALRVAEIGAAIGRSFPVDIVEALSPIKGDALRAALDELVRARLIEPVPDSAGAAFSFKHALVRDAAYSKLDGDALAPLHEDIGTALETMRPELVETEPQTLAFHFARTAAPSRAMPYLQKAGLRAASRAAHIEAANHYRTALDLLGKVPDRAQRLTEELGLQLQFALSESASIGYGAETVETAYGRARELCSLLGNPSELYVVLRGLCTFYIVRDKLSVARQLAEECIAIGRRTGRPEQLIEGYNALGYVLVHAGDLRGGREALEEVLRLYSDTHERGVIYGTEQDPAVAAGSLLSHATWLMGDREAGLRRRDDAIAHALTLNHPFTVAYAHTYAAMFGNIRLDFNDAAYHGRIAATISQEHGFKVWEATSSMQLALAEGALGKVKDAIETVSKILADYEAGGAELTVSYYCAGLCHNLRADGQLPEALAQAERGIAQARRTGEHFYLSVLLRQRGELLVALGQGALADAIEEIRSAVTLARRQGATELAARAVEALDRITAKLGKGIDPTSAMAASEASPAAVDL